MKDEKELAYRYDLFVTPDWRERFDALINESVELPAKGRVLDLNCGTGAFAIEIAAKMHGNGEVLGVDSSAERIEIAKAKALVKKAKDIRFEQGIDTALPFEGDEFDAVIGDASFTHPDQIQHVLNEMVRVVRPGGQVILKVTTRGSFDEFFSIYWEALHDIGMADEVWTGLEALINQRHTLSEAESIAERSGLREINRLASKEEFSFPTAGEFFDSPLIADLFLTEWLSIVPDERRQMVLERLRAIIERERNAASFDVSIKAAVIAGVKLNQSVTIAPAVGDQPAKGRLPDLTT